MNFRVAVTFAYVSLALSAGISTAVADEKTDYYGSRFYLSGMLLRSSRVCTERTSFAELKTRIDLALNLIATNEMKEFSKAFPKMSAERLEQGGAAFNQGVMTDGVSAACAYAEKVESNIVSQVHLGAENLVALIKSGGVYEVPVKINTVVTLNFVVDSGAAIVSVPADVVSTLYRAGTIGPSDFLGEEKYQLADGTVVPSPIFMLRSMQLGSTIVHNVKASIAKSAGPLLLGQSFLEQFGTISFDYDRQVLVVHKKK